MTRSCSSCSRTGRTRIGLTETSGEPLMLTDIDDSCIDAPGRRDGDTLTSQTFATRMSALIAAADVPSAGSATKTILIVDDDRGVAETFARMLKLEGFTVATAVDAEAGLVLANNVLPHAIILDMRMPIT